MHKYVTALIFIIPLLTNASPERIPARFTYEISSRTGEKSYVFGSSHTSPSNLPVSLSSCTKKFLSRSDRVFIEADLLAVKKLQLESIKTVSMSLVADEMTQPNINLLARLLFGNNAPADLDHLRQADAEVVLNILIDKIPEKENVLGVNDDGLDTEIKMSARFLGKPLSYLELPEEQLAFSKNVSPKDFSVAIKETMDLFYDKDAAVKAHQLTLLVQRAAAMGNEDELKQLVERNENAYDKATISGRNESLKDKILKILKESKKSNFIALGALHLVGDGSVIQRLQASGFQTKRLCQYSESKK